MNQLALQKKAFLIYRIGAPTITVLVSKTPPREDFMRSKAIITIDGHIINFASVSFIDEVNLNDETANTAKAYASDIKGPLGVVATERVRSYEATNGIMPLEKLINRLSDFQKFGSKKHTRLFELFLSVGGDKNLIG